MTSATTPIGNRPINSSLATSTQQSPATARIGPLDREAWIRHYEWEGAELPAAICAPPLPAQVSLNEGV